MATSVREARDRHQRRDREADAACRGGAGAARRQGRRRRFSRQAGEAAAEEAELITDAQGSAAYKKQLVRVYVARALRAALATGNGTT